MVVDAVAELRTIRASRDLYNTEVYDEKVDAELDRLIDRLINRQRINPREIERTVKKYIASVGSLIEKLEKEKRRVLSEAEKKLAEIAEMAKMIDGVNSPVIAKELGKLKRKVKRMTVQIHRGERRGTKGGEPIGYFIKKAAGRRRGLANAFRLLKREGKVESKEENIFEKIKIQIGLLSQGSGDREEIERTIIILIRDYEKDLDIILIIVVDFEIEEAERLHKIAQYRKLLDRLNVKEYNQKLDELRERALVWVYQDSQETKRMNELANGVEALIQKDSEIKRGSNDWDLSDIKTVEYPINRVMGNLYMRGTKRNYTKGVVMSHGMGGKRANIDVFAKRLAKTGYLVYCVNLPGHGDSNDEYGMVASCEIMENAVRYLRMLGCKRLAYLTHSMSAAATAMALVGYNRKIENEIYGRLERYFEFEGKAANALKAYTENATSSQGKDVIAGYVNADEEEMLRLQAEIEAMIIESIERVYANRMNADVVILLSPPKRLQAVVSPSQIRWFVKHKAFWSKMLLCYEIVGKEGMSKNSKMLKVKDKDEFLQTLLNIKGPKDYFGILYAFAEKSERIKRLLDERVASIPKLVVFGGMDHMVRNFFGISKEYRRIFGSLGNNANPVQFSYHPMAGHLYAGLHALNPKRFIYGMLKPYLAEEALAFLKGKL